MRRLYWRIYGGFVLILVLFALFVMLLGQLGGPARERERWMEAMAATVADLLPAQGVSNERLQRSLGRLARRFRSHVSLYDTQSRLLARAGEALPPPPLTHTSQWIRGRGERTFALALPDGRWLLIRHHPRRARFPFAFLSHRWPWVIAALALAIAIVAHPLARRLTRRMERLQAQVEALGEGDLSARVQEQGNDEVAELARSFNRCAARIEALVGAQRSTLASASHELRSPLARIRMAIELLANEGRESLKAQIVQDIDELDDLIEELLLASRLKTSRSVEVAEPVQLDALLQEEASRISAQVFAEPVVVMGSARLLRRMLRNLLENALRHGNGTEIAARLVTGTDGWITVLVEDRGPGVAPEIRDRIFEPFFRVPGMREGRDRGVGLGLSLVRQIARHHGGDATYESRKRGGSRFRVTLRAADSAAQT